MASFLYIFPSLYSRQSFFCSHPTSIAAAAVLPGPQQLGGVGAVRVDGRLYRPRALQ